MTEYHKIQARQDLERDLDAGRAPVARTTDVSRLNPLACGTTLTYVDGQMVDDEWHPVAIAHHDWIDGVFYALQRVRNLHRCNSEYFFPECAECGQMWPCSTIEALEGENP